MSEGSTLNVFINALLIRKPLIPTLSPKGGRGEPNKDLLSPTLGERMEVRGVECLPD